MAAKVLIVDDDEETRELLAGMLALEGFETDQADGAEEFRRKVFADKPALIILDIMLGADNGALFYEQLVKEGLDSKIPVIFLSGLVEDHPPSPASEGRTYSLRAKPFQMSELLHDMRYLLKERPK